MHGQQNIKTLNLFLSLGLTDLIFEFYNHEDGHIAKTCMSLLHV